LGVTVTNVRAESLSTFDFNTRICVPCPARATLKACTPSADCRCLCGSLMARIVAGGVELKCRRCKRTLLVPLQEHARPLEAPGPQDTSVHPEHR
jgi:hypothetical protein